MERGEMHKVGATWYTVLSTRSFWFPILFLLALDCKLWSIIGDEAKKKLQRLTIVQLACQQKQLHYSTIMETLGMDSVRELEDLIIDCIEYRLVRGKLDQKQQLFQVEWTMGRDVATTSQLDEMIDGFCRWENNAQLLLQKLNSQV